MNEIKQISSLQNPQIKKVLLLKEKKRGRNKSGLFVLEGVREFQMAVKGKFKIDTIFFYTGIISKEEIEDLLKSYNGKPQIAAVTKEVYQRIAYREKTEGLVAIANTKTHSLQNLKLRNKNPLILVAEALEKPGNLGALLRTADAAALDAVIIADPRGDLYNPNVIRSSVGCVFTLPIAVDTTANVIAYLKSNRIAIVAASLNASRDYSTLNYSGASAIVVGAESTGLTSQWIDGSDAQVLIPMRGEIDSMNVSVSAAILIFEAIRQRA